MTAPHKINLEMVTPVPQDESLGWKVELQGTVTIVKDDGSKISGQIVSIDHFEAAAMSSKFGRFEAGLRPEGYGSWMFREGPEAGIPGSALNVIYAIDPEGQMWIGGHLRKRANIHGGTMEMFDLGGGFTDPQDNSIVATALRESLEEQGVVIKPVAGSNLTPGIWNRLFQFVPVGGGNTHGIVPSLVEWNSLVEASNGRMGFTKPQIDLSALDADEATKAKAIKQAEQAANLIFIPALQAMARAHDDIVTTCIARVYSAYQLGNMSSPYSNIN